MAITAPATQPSAGKLEARSACRANATGREDGTGLAPREGLVTLETAGRGGSAWAEILPNAAPPCAAPAGSGPPARPCPRNGHGDEAWRPRRRKPGERERPGRLVRGWRPWGGGASRCLLARFGNVPQERGGRSPDGYRLVDSANPGSGIAGGLTRRPCAVRTSARASPAPSTRVMPIIVIALQALGQTPECHVKPMRRRW